MAADAGLRAGMTVRDAAGNRLGKVRRIYPWGFEVVRGFWSPYQWVFRHDEVALVQDGVVEVARRPDDLLALAAGELPQTWRRHTPAAGGASILAAPAEAQATDREQARPAGDGARATLDRGEEAEYLRTQGQQQPGPAHS